MQPNGGSYYLSLTNARGDTLAVGKGLSSTASFADAPWGGRGSSPPISPMKMGPVGNALMSLAQGGYFGSAGAALGDRTRLAVSWTSTPERAAWAPPTATHQLGRAAPASPPRSPAAGARP